MQLIVVGAGWAGEQHVKAIRALRQGGADCALATLVDTDRTHLAAKAAEWGVESTYTDLGQALAAEGKAIAVVLATPHHLHSYQTCQAAAAGMNVLVEKPMAVTVAEADAMIAACDQAGVTLMVAESARYQRANIAARDAIASGKIGQLLMGRMDSIVRGRHTYSYPGRRAWLADPKTPGAGIWMLNGIHQMSLARMLLGEPARIYARQVKSKKFQSPLEATVVAEISFDSGAEATMTVSAELHGYGRFGGLVLFGSDGTLQLARKADELIIYTDGGTETVACGEEDQNGAAPHFVRQMAEFLAAADQRRQPQTSGPSERRTLAAVLAGYESIRTGRPVEIE